MKVALVTGGSGEIGSQICLDLAQELGYHILLHYNKNENKANQALENIFHVGGKGELIQFDVTSFQQTTEILNNWLNKNPMAKIEVLVNNAGKINDGLFVFSTEEQYNEVVDIKLRGFFNVTQTIVKQMLLNRYGRIINVGSLSSSICPAGQVNYAAANAGLAAASTALSKEVSQRNITVNTIAPGYIESEMTSQLDYAKTKELIPAKKFGRAKDVSELVCFLASEKASYISGDTIKVSGGL